MVLSFDRPCGGGGKEEAEHSRKEWNLIGWNNQKESIHLLKFDLESISVDPKGCGRGLSYESWPSHS